MSNKPKREYAEHDKQFRLRIVEWCVRLNPGLDYDDLQSKVRKAYPKMPCSKESIARDVKILCKRGVLSRDADPQDHRRTVINPVAS